jgi:DNA-binding IclR family transcriptional regulator
LAAEFGETVHLGRLDGPNVVYMAKRESIHPLRLFSAIGRRLPAHATALGKALLAERGDAEVAAILPSPLPRLTARTLVTPRELGDDIKATRERGYAVDREENTDGIVCIAMAVPLRKPANDAISLSIPISRLAGGVEPRIVDGLRRAVDQVRAARGLLAGSW